MVKELNCIWCGDIFIQKKVWQKTCKPQCGWNYQNSKKPKKINNKKCMRCDRSLEHKKSHAIYCSKTCKSMDHTYKHRAKTRIFGVSRRMEIIKRDNFCCYMCGLKLEVNQVELDHLIPVSKGGSSSPENVAVSCMFCNRSRSNRIGEQQLRKIQDLKAKYDN